MREKTDLNPVVPRPSRNVLPNLIPLALRNENVLAVTCALLPSAPNHVFPAPSSPAGHRMLAISLNDESDDDGCPSSSAPCSGMGTSDDENDVAPVENGTLGLFVLLTVVPLPWNEARKEPAKKRDDAEELVVMERTSPPAPVRPPKGADDHEFCFASHTRTASVKSPPAQTWLFAESQ